LVKELLRRGWVRAIVGVSVGIAIRGIRSISRKSGAAILDRVARLGWRNSRKIGIDRFEIGIGHAVISGPGHDLKCGSVRAKGANRVVRFMSILAVNVFSSSQNFDEFGLSQPLGHTVAWLRCQIARHKRPKALSTCQIVGRIKVRHQLTPHTLV